MKKILNYFLFPFILMSSLNAASEKPNVVIVITDDQGYYDLGCHGNPVIKTPGIDKFYENAVRFTNYHVDPTCAPTRAALMTGRYSDRCGVWHTILGRSMLRTREVTMADVFTDNGYATGIFGKWHLGDAYPYRPEDRGFQYVAMHGGGGITQTPDYWGNDYFNDTYWVNGKWVKFDGFCTDIWFDQSIKFMRESKAAGKPFFSYITLNAPHGPKRAPKKYVDMYADTDYDNGTKNFLGMITNIDDNFVKLQKFLDEEGLTENTILIFTTDNGTAGGNKVYQGAQKGGKGSAYEGGHQVPFLVQWPKGKIEGGKDVDQLLAHVDILPTFIDLLDLKAPSIEFDGSNVKPLLYGDKDSFRNRTLVVESQRVPDPIKWRKCSVMNDQWRLVNGKELYDIKKDPAQKENVAVKFPEIVEQLTASYDDFWTSVSEEHDLTSYMMIGSAHQNPTILTGQDLMGKTGWSQSLVSVGADKPSYWSVEVEKDGNYEVSIRRWPAEADKAINDKYISPRPAYDCKTARLDIGGNFYEQAIVDGATEVTFKVKLKKGLTKMDGKFVDAKGKQWGAFYAYALNTDVYDGKKEGWQTREGLGYPLAIWAPDYPDYEMEKKAAKNKKPKKKKK